MNGEDDAMVAQIRRKAERLARSRRRPPSFWRQLGNVGVLGWLFILPLVGFMGLGHWLGRRVELPWLGLAGGALGLFAGGYGVYRAMRKSLDEAESSEAESSEAESPDEAGDARHAPVATSRSTAVEGAPGSRPERSQPEEKSS